MMKPRFNPNRTDAVAAQKTSSRKDAGTPEERLLIRIESLEERLCSLEFSSSIAGKQRITSASKADQCQSSRSTPSSLWRLFSLRKKSQEENPQKKSSPIIPTPPIPPVISVPPLAQSVTKTKPIVAVIPPPPKLPATIPSEVAPPPPLRDNLFVAEQPSGKKNFMEELQDKKLKPLEGEKRCSSPEGDVQENLIREMMNKKLQPISKRSAIQAPVAPQLSELARILAKQRQAIDGAILKSGTVF